MDFINPRGSSVDAADASYYPQLGQHLLGIFSVFDGNWKKHNALMLLEQSRTTKKSFSRGNDYVFSLPRGTK